MVTCDERAQRGRTQAPPRRSIASSTTTSLLRRALTDPELRRHFQSELERCARTAERDGWLEAAIVRSSSLIRPAALLDPRKPYSGADHDAAVATLREFARARPGRVLTEVR